MGGVGCGLQGLKPLSLVETYVAVETAIYKATMRTHKTVEKRIDSQIDANP